MIPDLGGCGRPAVRRVEIYASDARSRSTSMDGSIYTCDEHHQVAGDAIRAAGFVAHSMPVSGPKRCGDGLDFTGSTLRVLSAPEPLAKPDLERPAVGAADEVAHPAWCGRTDAGCTVLARPNQSLPDAAHRSLPTLLDLNAAIGAPTVATAWVEQVAAPWPTDVYLVARVADLEVYLPVATARTVLASLTSLVEVDG